MGLLDGLLGNASELDPQELNQEFSLITNKLNWVLS